MIRILRRAAYVPHIRSIGKKEPRRTDYQSGQFFIHNEYDYKGIILYQGKFRFMHQGWELSFLKTSQYLERVLMESTEVRNFSEKNHLRSIFLIKWTD